MNRKGRDRGAEMWLTARTSKLIPETRRGVPKGAELQDSSSTTRETV